MSTAKPHILVVDDEGGHVIMLTALLGKWGYAATGVHSGREAVEAVSAQPFDLVLMDVRMEDTDGLTALKAIKAHNPAVPVVMMTAFSTVASAVDALKSGASDYLLKPLDFDNLRSVLDTACAHRDKGTGCPYDDPAARDDMGMLGHSPVMEELRQLIRTVAPADATVLISGPSGTGKELVARAIHHLSPRNNGPLVVVNCAALSENLLESELFGHEKGAFTGADRQREGRFLQAHGGTIFLDEIGEIPPTVQAKLLRVLQQKEVQRVGSDTTFTVDVRIIAATNRDLRTEAEAKRFREDLYYRLNVLHLQTTALQKRPEDIALLAAHFAARFAERHRKPDFGGFSPQAMDAFLRYAWPGNVRELENTVEQAVVLSQSTHIGMENVPAHVKAQEGGSNGANPALETLEDMEREAILRTLRLTGDNKTDAAERLGISRKTLYAKLKRYEEE